MTPARSWVLDELDQTGVLADLEGTEAIALAGTGLVEVRPEPAGWRLLPRGRVGSVRIGEVQVDVRPKDKVGLTRMLFLLGYARDPGFVPGTVSAAPDDDLWPAIAESLVRLARAALGAGVLQGYRGIDDSLRELRGRIRIGDQITRHPGRMVPIEVSYDEYTSDIPENRLLRGALRRMLAVPRLERGVRSSLAHLDGRLDGVGIPIPGTRLPTWQPTRLNRHYAPALRLAELILRNLSAELGSGGIRTAAFVVDMAQVYEAFVTTALGEALARYPGGCQAQYRTRLDDGPGGGGITMYVDLVHLDGGRPRLVFDAKYKAASADGAYANADHYQMLAYCTALAVPRAWLVYARGGPRRVRRIVNTGISVIEYALDLGAAPRVLLAQIDGLAREAWASLDETVPQALVGATG